MIYYCCELQHGTVPHHNESIYTSKVSPLYYPSQLPSQALLCRSRIGSTEVTESKRNAVDQQHVHFFIQSSTLGTDSVEHGSKSRPNSLLDEAEGLDLAAEEATRYSSSSKRLSAEEG
jgi:hypothetical protein